MTWLNCVTAFVAGICMAWNADRVRRSGALYYVVGTIVAAAMLLFIAAYYFKRQDGRWSFVGTVGSLVAVVVAALNASTVVSVLADPWLAGAAGSAIVLPCSVGATVWLQSSHGVRAALNVVVVLAAAAVLAVSVWQCPLLRGEADHVVCGVAGCVAAVGTVLVKAALPRRATSSAWSSRAVYRED